MVNLNEMVTGIEQELGKSAIKKSANATWRCRKTNKYTKKQKPHQLFTQNKIPKWHKNFCGMVLRNR